MSARTYTRRELALGALTGFVLLSSTNRAAESPPARRLTLRNIHTGQHVSVTFSSDGQLAPPAAAELRHLLRDYRTGDEHDIDPGLFALLLDLAQQAGLEATYDVISGYRSPATNARLRADGHAVAEHSQHMEGRAMDVRLESCPLERLRDLALAAKRGGVGFYPRSGFVHIDTGRVRSWHE